MHTTSPATLLRSVAWPRFLVSAWLWRGLAYGASTAVISGLLWLVLAWPAAALIGAITMADHGHPLKALPLAVVGLGLLALVGPPVALGVGRVERLRLRLADDRPARTVRGGNLYLDPATWRAFAYLLVLAIIAPLWLGCLALGGLVAAALIATPLALQQGDPIVVGPETVHSTGYAYLLALAGVVLLPVLGYLVGAVGGAHAALTRALLCVEPDPAAAQLVAVAQSRTRLADAFDAERHRIERDLHDGAQQRLVNLTMQLGLAKMDLPAGSPAAVAVTSAHDQAKALMVELRDLIRGINPRSLTELGLPAALEELAAASPVPVTVRAATGRLPSTVETVAYFAVSEALTNVTKHSGATGASITASRTGNTLSVEVADDGRGGADPARGSGLTGLSDRVAAAGGRLLLSSPAGGPTVVRIELPCGS